MNLRGGHKRLRGGHIIVAAEQSRPSTITFKKVTRVGRKAIYKKTVLSNPDVSRSDPAPPSPEPRHLLPDDTFVGAYSDHAQDSAEAEWEDEEDFRLPRRRTVRKCFFCSCFSVFV